MFAASMMSGQAVFKGAVGWDDWLWWIVLGSVALLILLLLVCCCVCMQRAKRKGHEEALASVQTHQRRTQALELAEQQQQQRYQLAQQQQRYQPTQHANIAVNGYQPPGSGYSQPVTAVPLAVPPHRKNLGPQVAANGYRTTPSQRINDQYAKPYPPLPARQVDRPVEQRGQYQASPNRYHVPNRSPSGHGYEANGNSRGFGYEPHPDSIRYDDSYAPIVAVTSPSSNRPKGIRTNGVKLAASSAQKHAPVPVVVPRNAPVPSSPFDARPSGATLQARIDALRSEDSGDMVHSRIDRPDIVGPVSTSQSPRIVHTAESYTTGSARRSGLLMGSLLSPNSTAVTTSRFTSPASSSQSTRSYASYDPDTFNGSKFSEAGDANTQRSTQPDRSGSEYKDNESGAQGERPASSRATATTPSRQRGNHGRGSVEF